MNKERLFLTEREEDKKEYLREMELALGAIVDAYRDGRAYVGMEPQKLAEFMAEDTILPNTGLGFDAALAKMKDKIIPYLVHPSSAAYTPHLHSPALMETLAADAVISAFNQSMDTWDQSPAATQTECEVIRTLCSLYGFDEKADGVFTSGGTDSNFEALLISRDLFCDKFGWNIRMNGLPDEFRKLRVYTSQISYFSVRKSMHLMGLGYNSVVLVPVDENFRMDAKALEKFVEDDIACGNIPFCAIATCGTTDFGTIDPIEEIHAICQKYGMRLHCDAAYGSALILSDNYRSRIAGISLADSLTVDFHKMFMLPISCSSMLLKNGDDFKYIAFHSNYLNREEDEEEGFTNLVGKSLQTTRRFDALKVWMSFQSRGRDGWAKLIDEVMKNSEYLYEKLDGMDGFETLVRSEISSVVFRVDGSNELNRSIRLGLLEKHGTVIGQTSAMGKTWLKCTILNPNITKEKIDWLLSEIIKTAKEVA